METKPQQHAGASHGSVRSYVLGFILSVVLTLVPFGLVMYPELGLSQGTVLAAILGMALLQILVQLGFFLHMNTHSDEGWNMIAFVFTALIIVILVVGSLWIMTHLNHNMMAH